MTIKNKDSEPVCYNLLSQPVLCDTSQKEEVLAGTPQLITGLSLPLVGSWCSERAPEQVCGQPPLRLTPQRTAVAPGSCLQPPQNPPISQGAKHPEPPHPHCGRSTPRTRGSSPPQRLQPAEHRLLLSFTHSFIHQGATLRGPASARQPRVHLPAGPPVQPPSYGTMVHFHPQFPSTLSHFLSLRETLHGLVPGSFSHHRCAWGS